MKMNMNADGARLIAVCWTSVALTLGLSFAETAMGSDLKPGAPASGLSVQDVALHLQTANAEPSVAGDAEPRVQSLGLGIGAGSSLMAGSDFFFAMGGGFGGKDDDDDRDDDDGDDDGDDDRNRDRKGKRGGPPVPEPSTWMGLGSLLGVCLLAASLRKRK